MGPSSRTPTAPSSALSSTVIWPTRTSAAQRGERGRAAVLARHTFDERARVLRETVEPLLPVARAR